MTNVLCWRCSAKLGWTKPNADGVTFRCQACGAKTQVKAAEVLRVAFTSGEGKT